MKVNWNRHNNNSYCNWETRRANLMRGELWDLSSMGFIASWFYSGIKEIIHQPRSARSNCLFHVFSAGITFQHFCKPCPLFYLRSLSDKSIIIRLTSITARGFSENIAVSEKERFLIFSKVTNSASVVVSPQWWKTLKPKKASCSTITNH